jgi:RHS repeat-associated protein
MINTGNIKNGANAMPFYNYLTSKKSAKKARSNYELKDHLGNIRTVISDSKLIVDSDANNVVSSADNFVPEVRSYTDYYPFGFNMPGRQYSSGTKYRYTYNGKETDQETGTQDYGMRILDNRIAKFLSVDPLALKYAMLTPYQYASNRPIDGTDLDGMEYNPFMVSWGASRQAAYGNAKNDAERKEVSKTTTSQAQVTAKIGIVVGGAMGLGYMGYAAIPYLTGALSYASTPNGQQMIMEGTSLLANIFYQGPDDPFPTNGPGGEVGKAFGKYFGGLFKAPVVVGKLFEAASAKGFKFIKGFSGKKTAVIGQGMGRVEGVGAGLKNAEVFQPSKEASEAWEALLEKSGGKQLSDEAVQGTQLFKENQQWIDKVKKEGYDIIDIGADASGKASTFYSMEKKAVYGEAEK